MPVKPIWSADPRGDGLSSPHGAVSGVSVATAITVGEFREQIRSRPNGMGLKEYASFLRHDSRDDKYLREEHLPIFAVLNHLNVRDAQTLELGREAEGWDARLDCNELFEVVQALPRDEHVVRKEIANGGQSPVTYWQHASDHLQFPQVIVDAIEMKHKKSYSDSRTLIVSFGGDYSREDDEVVSLWIAELRRKTQKGTFGRIILVEVDRLKAFPLF